MTWRPSTSASSPSSPRAHTINCLTGKRNWRAFVGKPGATSSMTRHSPAPRWIRIVTDLIILEGRAHQTVNCARILNPGLGIRGSAISVGVLADLDRVASAPHPGGSAWGTRGGAWVAPAYTPVGLVGVAADVQRALLAHRCRRARPGGQLCRLRIGSAAQAQRQSEQPGNAKNA